MVIPLSNNYTLYTIPPPGSGVVLGHILKLLSENLEYDLLDKLNNWQRILESFKFAYGMRTHLGDPLFMPEVKTVCTNNNIILVKYKLQICIYRLLNK